MAVGASTARIDAADKLIGTAEYPGDRIPADALWAMAVFTDQPHARLLSLDFSGARAVGGVVEVFGSAHVPINEFGLTMADHPVFVGLEHTGRSPVPCDVSRWEADRLALVVAETPEAARAGAAAIEAQWEPLEVLADIDQSLASDILLHPENGKASNTYYSLRIRKGDMARGWADADTVVESTYEFPYQEHAYLQPEAGMAYIDGDGRVTVEAAGQWTHEDREQIAHALDLPEERVRVIYPAIGGAFGGREDISVQIVLALAAVRLHERGIDRPVATVWSREESIVGHGKRHRGRITARWGARRDGRITAVKSTAWLDAGSYNFTSNKVLGNCHLHQSGPYEVPNAEIDSLAVYTNATPAGAFRGFGAPQAAFAAESQVNKLAEALGMDPVDIRRINTLREGSIGITQTPMPEGVTMPEVIDGCAEAAAEPAYDGDGADFSPFPSLPPEPSALRRGRGFACSFKNVGFSFGYPERCEAEIVLHGDADSDEPEWAELYHAGAEVGQGAHTALVQMAAEATGLPADRIERRFSDTATSGDAGSASASRLTWMSGQLDPGRGRGGREGLARRPAARGGPVPVRASPHRGAGPRRRPRRPQLQLRVRGPARGPDRRRRHRPHPGGPGGERPRRGPGHQPPVGGGPDRGRCGSGSGLCPQREPSLRRWPAPEHAPQHLPDPRNRRHPDEGRQRGAGVGRPARTLGRPGHGRDGNDPLCPRGGGRPPRRHRRLVRQLPADTRPGPGRPPRGRRVG